VPCGVEIVVRLLAAGAVTLEAVERAANPIPVRMNGGARVCHEDKESSLPPTASFHLEPLLEASTDLAEPVLEPSAPFPVTAVLPEVTEPLAIEVPAALEPEPPAPLHLEPALEATTDLRGSPGGETDSQPAPEPSAPAADLTTTAEKVVALSSSVCHWPCGDPQYSDFRFCGEATTLPPYCDAHRGVAYLALPPRPVRRKRRRLYSSPRIAWAGSTRGVGSARRVRSFGAGFFGIPCYFQFGSACASLPECLQGLRANLAGAEWIGVHAVGPQGAEDGRAFGDFRLLASRAVDAFSADDGKDWCGLVDGFEDIAGQFAGVGPGDHAAAVVTNEQGFLTHA
jgi:hypothetical protein